jgi:lysine-ketoglutarate reductase/saccharopine dehydrogenase-like protein (TIGR00300 family)
MCAPDYFAVEYVINPWMEGHIGRTSRDAARRQWDSLYAEISNRTRVELIQPGPRLPDMCFAANAGLVVGRQFICSAFRVNQRRPEEALYSAWFKEHSFDVVRPADDEPFEGEGDALIQPGQPLLWAGYGVRSSLDSHRSLSELLKVEVVSLRLVDQRFYHLDTCLYPLPGQRLVYYPAAFDEMSLREICQRIPAADRIEVSEADALQFTCNALCLGDTIITNHASDGLRRQLLGWGFNVVCCPVDEFMLSGGAVKCLSLLLDQDLGSSLETRPRVESTLCSTRLALQGHLLDSGILNRAIDVVTEGGGSCRIDGFDVGERRDQTSSATLRVTAPNAERLDHLVSGMLAIGAKIAEPATDANLEQVTQAGVAPASFYATTIYPTEIRLQGKWVRVAAQRMDAVIVIQKVTDPARSKEPLMMARCRLIRELQPGDHVVCGVTGVRVITPPPRRETSEAFSFMSMGVSTERRVELSVDALAWEMRRIRSRSGKIVVVAGPVVIHTGGGRYLVKLIEQGYVQVLLTGNALPVHDLELNLFGTSLGVDLGRGIGIHGGHTHHLRAINTVRAAGSIAATVHNGTVTGGVMHACVKHNVPFVIAGSIRDDGPLPDTIMDLVQAQAEYAAAIEGADMILMLSSMLHSIGTGNMTPAGVRLVCIDINPAVVTKLADRGSLESTGIVTDVGLFLNLLAARLTGEEEL